MPRPPTGQLAQACLHVQDLDRALSLYRDLLGMPESRVVRRDPPARSVAILGTRDTILEIACVPGDEPPTGSSGSPRRGLHHIAVWVEGLDELEKRLTTAGFPFLRPKRRAADWIGMALDVGRIEDADGVTVELLEWVGPAGPG